MTNISPKIFAKLLMAFQYSFQSIERIIEMCSHILGNRLTIGSVISPSQVFRVRRKTFQGD